MILLWGVPEDPPIAAVLAALRSYGISAQVFFFNQHESVVAQVQLRVSKHARVDGTLSIGRRLIDLSTVDAAYLRPWEPGLIPAIAAATADSRQSQLGRASHDLLLSWADLTPTLVINRPSAMVSNNSKPFQSVLARTAGFDVPETLVTTCPTAARRFARRYRRVVYKAVSGYSSRTRMLDTRKRNLLCEVRWCPTQFQEYIEGTEYRVHVVGEQVFATEIISRAVDYRYAHAEGNSLTMRSVILAPELSNRCIRLAKMFQLSVAGIDLRLTPENRWVCFEVNPSPGFTFYQQYTAQPISHAIASLLIMAGGRS
jgi:hypothetical protein